MLQLDREVEFRDYGAGADGHSADEMAHGVAVRRRLGDVCRVASNPPRHGRFLFGVVRETRPAVCLELGTCLGVSAAYQAAALKVNGCGFLYSIEGARPLAEQAQAFLGRLGLSELVDIRIGRFTDVLPDLLAERRFDFVFLDGHHDEIATRDYFEQIWPAMTPGGVMVFDDIAWSEGMKRAWQTIRQNDAVKKSWTFLGMGVAELG